jgi:hypothetical protein
MIYIEENFLPTPNIIRQWALSHRLMDQHEYSAKTNARNTWPGKRTEDITLMDRDYANFCLSKATNIIKRNNPQFYDKSVSVSSFFQLIDGSEKSWVHQDSSEVQYAGVLYLTPNAPYDAGTITYRCNNVTKWTSLFATHEGFEKSLHINEDEETELFKELFSPIDYVGNIYNRLIIYDAHIYHKAGRYFGTTPENSRLTQVFFFTFE